MPGLRKGVVVNAASELIGKTALIRDHENPDCVWAQFDDRDFVYFGVALGHGWRAFHRDAFDVEGEEAGETS